jgi:hypothetical protein
MICRKELGFDPASTLPLIRRWGPSLRTVSRIIECPREDAEFVTAARAAAMRFLVPELMQVPTIPHDIGDTLLFLRPQRLFRDDGTIEHSRGVSYIPTQHLGEILDVARSDVSKERSLEVFCTLSSHALTRTRADWMHEKDMHYHLSLGREALPISLHDKQQMQLEPATLLLAGTTGGIKNAPVRHSFYWIPSAVNLPGIDGVLGDISCNIYALQATIAGSHGNPKDGLSKLWTALAPEIRQSFTWHFVVVGNKQADVDLLVTRFSHDLAGFTLGHDHPRVQVKVGGCVLRRSRSVSKYL